MSVLKKRQQKEEIKILKVRTPFLNGKILHVYLEQKADLAVRGECAAPRRFFEAEADMEIRNWEQKGSDTALYETNENSNLKDWSCTKQINGLIRLKETEKINLRGEFEMRNRLFQEPRKRLPRN